MMKYVNVDSTNVYVGGENKPIKNRYQRMYYMRNGVQYIYSVCHDRCNYAYLARIAAGISVCFCCSNFL